MSFMKISTDSYKGVRDFYPEDKFIQEYIFNIWRKTVKSFGYEEYDASILESADLYKAKSGEEIVKEQTYTFTDRGEREVTLRPEMTPTVARMVAKRKRELVFPLRWFSIPNLFRYEQPQRGRTREHWQLNVDLFGLDSVYAELEIVEIAYKLLRNFGLQDSQFEILISDRKIINQFCEDSGLDHIQTSEFSRLLDKKKKIKESEFNIELEKIMGKKVELNLKPNETIQTILDSTKERGISNISFDPTITRGFDYYTGFVFEVYDTSGENRRALFGGGRYDDLLDIFGADKIPAVGFGYGDVTMRDVLETYDLLPTYQVPAQISLCPINDSFFEIASEWASSIRDSGVNVSVDYSSKKVGDLIKNADKRKIPFIAVIGEEEVESGKLKVKNLKTGEENVVDVNEVVKLISSK